MSTGGGGDEDSYVIVILSLCLSLSLSSLFALLSFCDVYQPPCSMYMLHGLNLYFVRCDILVSMLLWLSFIVSPACLTFSVYNEFSMV